MYCVHIMYLYTIHVHVCVILVKIICFLYFSQKRYAKDIKTKKKEHFKNSIEKPDKLRKERRRKGERRGREGREREESGGVQKFVLNKTNYILFTIYIQQFIHIIYPSPT